MGRADLFERYSAVVDEIEALDRSRHRGDRRPKDAPLIVGGTQYRLGAVTPELQLWSRHDRLRHEIDAVLGTGGAKAADFAFVQVEARWAPVVYLVAAQDTGYAVVVRPAGPPKIIWLPRLTRDEVDDRARLLIDEGAGLGQIRERLGPLLGWLWTAAMRAVVATVPPDAEVALVAVGALGLLPLHAATDPADGSAVCDRVALRYVPNASMAAAARQMAREQDRLPGPVLVVAVPAAPRLPEIRGAKDEAVAVARGYGNRARTLLDASLDDVRAALPGSAVWHLACHGTAVADRPLESALFLHDGELRLRDVLAMPPGGHRLAVLSACRSATPDPARLDEVVGFPAGLLQAGVAGVVSTQWVVGDNAAHVVTVRFHQLLRSGQSPARALARVQSWARTATNGEVIAALGPDYRPPDGLPQVALSDPGWLSQRPFANPALWATFAMTGA